MTIDDEAKTANERPSSPRCEALETRRSVLRRAALTSLPRRLSIASAALFAGMAARGTSDAEAHPGQGNFGCCALARTDRWCAPASGTAIFSCDHGGNKRVWYCCDFSVNPAVLVGCGECISGTGTCYDGPVFNCSYGWVDKTFC